MAKVKLDLEAQPTFKHTVGIPTPSGAVADVEFVFKYRDRVEMAALMDSYYARAKTREEAVDSREGEPPPLVDLVRDAIGRDVDAVLEVATGWDLRWEFNAESVGKLARLYPAAPLTIIEDYRVAILEGRRKN